MEPSSRRTVAAGVFSVAGLLLATAVVILVVAGLIWGASMVFTWLAGWFG